MSKNITTQLAALVLQIFPIATFLGIARMHSFAADAWSVAFQFASGAVATQLAIYFLMDIKVDYFVLAIDLFLFGGAAAFSGILPLFILYDTFETSMLMLCLFIVGAVATVCKPSRFLGLENMQSSPKIRMYSLALLGCTAFGFCISFIWTGDVLLAGYGPFIALMIARSILARMARA